MSVLIRGRFCVSWVVSQTFENIKALQRWCWESLSPSQLYPFCTAGWALQRFVVFFEGWELSSDMVRCIYNSSTKEFIHIIREQYFKDPWLSLSLHCSRDSTSRDLPKEETAGVLPIGTTPFPTAAFNSFISPSTPPLCISSLIPQTLIGHSQVKWRVVELTQSL